MGRGPPARTGCIALGTRLRALIIPNVCASSSRLPMGVPLLPDFLLEVPTNSTYPRFLTLPGPLVRQFTTDDIFCADNPLHDHPSIHCTQRSVKRTKLRSETATSCHLKARCYSVAADAQRRPHIECSPRPRPDRAVHFSHTLPRPHSATCSVSPAVGLSANVT